MEMSREEALACQEVGLWGDVKWWTDSSDEDCTNICELNPTSYQIVNLILSRSPTQSLLLRHTSPDFYTCKLIKWKTYLIWFSSPEESGFSKNNHWLRDAIFHWQAAEMGF